MRWRGTCFCSSWAVAEVGASLCYVHVFRRKVRCAEDVCSWFTRPRVEKALSFGGPPADSVYTSYPNLQLFVCGLMHCYSTLSADCHMISNMMRNVRAKFLFVRTVPNIGSSREINATLSSQTSVSVGISSNFFGKKRGE